jgi:hypothetical protein
MKFAVWGYGIASSKLVRDGKSSDVALTVAVEHRETEYGIGWAVEVEAEQTELDFETKFDQAVIGFAPIPCSNYKRYAKNI